MLFKMSDMEMIIDNPPAITLGKGKAPSATGKGDDNLPWVEKYRPSSLDDVAGHESIISTIRTFISSNKVPHLLFYGPPGTGKTSTILAVAREIYGNNFKNMVLELNASDERGIDVVRDQIKTFASTRQMFSKGFKLIILDEADAMTNAAQNALRRIMEKYTTHTRFCILANYIHKLAPAIQSRCTRFRFAPIPQSSIRKRVQTVIESENVNISDEAFKSLLSLAKGDMRRALNVLQACHVARDDDSAAAESSPITEGDIYECVGNPRPDDIRMIMDTMMSEEWGTALRTIRKIKQTNGIALADILQGLFEEIERIQVKPITRAEWIMGLAEIEYRLSSGGSENLQTSGMIGVIKSGLDYEQS
ncbi:P-loop containing nucleoside triphosphate hydrolase protein [Lipomyces tetrasporus]|uniref:Replication factor C subunit 3 n=1 Tax=Lipomyces tetrasporus TaxID=54092 RepID=A0AAD7VWQ4_9ASCO|nr:P-loop containing nucleoside triphosphate hydrolase protein [Lipomyces tetrasporus]KAJ8104289.1 P-loop containing nucleoside triphosphate hydrolase protein [Lipomyces tetrasporus]